MKAKEESTFSKLNIDFSKLNKDTTATMTENSQRNTQISDYRDESDSFRILESNRKKSVDSALRFGYPTYLVTENYHITDKSHGGPTGLQVLPNRDINHQIESFR